MRSVPYIGSALVLALAAALFSSCTNTGPPPPKPAASGAAGAPDVEAAAGATAPAVQAWTRHFADAAVLVADEIEIEGPRGLLEHVVLRQDQAYANYKAETTEHGFEQELTLRAGAPMVDLRGQLDQWVLVATRRMRVLERPGAVPVIVRGRGHAVWRPVAGAGERRGAALDFQAELGRP